MTVSFAAGLAFPTTRNFMHYQKHTIVPCHNSMISSVRSMPLCNRQSVAK